MFKPDYGGLVQRPAIEVQGRVRGGRPFLPVLERNLNGHLRSLAHGLPGARQSLILAEEFAGPVGVVDLLAVTRATDALERRRLIGPPFLTSLHDAAVLAALHEHVTRTESHLAQKLGTSISQLRRRLRYLETFGFVRRHGNGFRRSSDLGPAGRAYALEAKVSDWRRGLAQALKYASWCDAASVVLLRAPSDPAVAVAHYSSLGIGLALEDHWLVQPRIGRPNRARRLLLAETVAEAYYRVGSEPSSRA
jgi:DNA-binding Lrp family transcriptional regulator